MLALITNDDGIDSPGLAALTRGALAAGFEVVVAAPHVDSTGVGASVYAVAEERRVKVHERPLPGLDVPAFSVEGHPAFIVHSAFEGWLDRLPDVVLSGINIGANVGGSVIHSGTVGAALTAAMHGRSALATSLDCGLAVAAEANWETVLAVLPESLALLAGRPAGSVLSLNVPDRPAAEIGPLREAALAAVGAVQVRIAHTSGVDGAPATLQATIESPDEPSEPGTDVALLAAGHPTITQLRSVSAVPGLL
ncbi:5'/3'-nucleotidase SurE [Pseudonocardia xishanensis]|uniref:5'-nucleotidase n=1 Tax=Pseudonocardia xishanensis TaxID=630995 RepID=A0ABP8RCS8_9PSEU